MVILKSNFKGLLRIILFNLIVFRTRLINAARDIAADKELLCGKHFITGTVKYPPYISYKLDAKGHIYDIAGFVHEIILYIGTKYQFTFEYVESPAWGAFVNGSWNGLIGLLQQGEIDLAATGLTVTYPRSKVVDFCVPYVDDPMAIMIPYPELDSTISAISRPFHYEVWLSILVSWIVCAVVLGLISSVEFSWFNKTRMTITKHFWILFSILANAGSRISPTLPIRLVASVWCLVSVVLVNAYTCILTSYLMSPRFHAMVDSIEDIAAIPRPILMFERYTAYESFVLEAESGALGKLAEIAKKHPKELSLRNDERVADLIVQYKRAFSFDQSNLLTMIEQDLKETGTCRLSLAKKPWGVSQTAFALKKLSPVTQIFNTEIIWLRQVGLLDHWQRKFWSRPNRCSDELARLQVNKKTKLSMYYLSSIFLLLGSGIAISFFVFIIEIIVAKFFKKQN